MPTALDWSGWIIYTVCIQRMLQPHQDHAHSLWLQYSHAAASVSAPSKPVILEHVSPKVPCTVCPHGHDTFCLICICPINYCLQLAKTTYVAGETYSIADIAVVSWAIFSAFAGLDVTSYKNVNRWLTLVRARPAVVAGCANPAATGMLVRDTRLLAVCA